MTKMTHPDSKQTIDVADEQVREYEKQGWSVKPARKK